MSLENQLTEILSELKGITLTPLYPVQSIISLIDLTLLDAQASFSQIEALASKASRWKTAALCILPQHLSYLPKNIHVPLATVLNFPTGNEPQSDIKNKLESLRSYDKLAEIDYVFPYQAYLKGQPKKALNDCREVCLMIKQYGFTCKIILETGAFPSLDTIFSLSIQLIEMGCDFLKTSTGMISTGATIPAAFAMLSALKETKSCCGIKISGGIKTLEQAYDYIKLAQFILNKTPNSSWFRFGASSLLDCLLSNDQGNPHQCAIPGIA